MTEDPRGSTPQSRRRIKAWRYDEGYGEHRYAPPDETAPAPRRRRRDGRRSRSRRGLLGWLKRSPLWQRILAALAGFAGLWLLWPTVMSSPLNDSARRPGAADVITVFVEDPQRTLTALDLWRKRPGSLLVLQGEPDSQEVNRRKLSTRGLRPGDPSKDVVTLTRGCDTLGQLTTLATFLETVPGRPGRLTVVTGPAHLPRALAIARIVVGGAGWRVQGRAARTDDNRPESPWRLLRDQARAQLWRLNRWDGSGDGTACRARGLTEPG